MKKILILNTITLILTLSSAIGQTPGPYYRQFFFNPYLFNPAYVAINNEAEANLAYRQQWVNFKDAPVTAGFNVQFPTSERVSLGFSLLSDKQVLIRNTNFMATFGYVVPITSNQSLRFGLSGGVGLTKLDLTPEELNSNDPAILNASNKFYVDGNFGVVYSYGGLRVGFALTDFLKSNAFSTGSNNEFELSNLRNRFYSVSYKFNLDAMGNVALDPFFLYRQTEDGLQDAWEAGSLIYFKDKLWTGGSYNQNKGLALFLGMNLKEKFRFSYSYEFPPFTPGFTSSSSHELHLSIKIGKKKPHTIAKTNTHNSSRELANNKTIEPENTQDYEIGASENENVDSNVVLERNKNPEEVVSHEELQPKGTGTKAESKVQAKEHESKTEEPKVVRSRPTESFTMTRGHSYVVVGVFRVMNHSVKFTKEMMDKGHIVNVVLNPKNNLYYVYTESSLDLEEAKLIRNEFRRKNLFKEAWVYTME